MNENDKKKYLESNPLIECDREAFKNGMSVEELLEYLEGCISRITWYKNKIEEIQSDYIIEYIGRGIVFLSPIIASLTLILLGTLPFTSTIILGSGIALGTAINILYSLFKKIGKIPNYKDSFIPLTENIEYSENEKLHEILKNLVSDVRHNGIRYQKKGESIQCSSNDLEKIVVDQLSLYTQEYHGLFSNNNASLDGCMRLREIALNLIKYTLAMKTLKEEESERALSALSLKNNLTDTETIASSFSEEETPTYHRLIEEDPQYGYVKTLKPVSETPQKR